MSQRREPDDDALGQLLAEGLGRVAARPVDDGELLAGARRGAARIRRRRRTVLTVASVLVIGSPVGLAVSELGGSSQTSHITSEAAPAAASAGDTSDSSAAGADRQGVGAQTAMPEAAAGPTPVPDAALLTAADLRAATLRQTSDTSYPGPVPAAATADTCGSTLDPVPAAFGRARVLERRTGSSSATWWLLGNTVRVFAGDGAREYVAAASGLSCVTGVAVQGADLAVVGHGGTDAQGRTHWYAGARVGRVVTEVRLVVPSGSRITRTDVVGLLASAAQKVTSSGLPATAGVDPAPS
jgi:hypothetical protein